MSFANEKRCVCGKDFCYACGEIWGSCPRSHQWQTRKHYDSDAVLESIEDDLQKKAEESAHQNDKVDHMSRMDPSECRHQEWRHTAKGHVLVREDVERQRCIKCQKEFLWFLECRICGLDGVCDYCKSEFQKKN